MTNLKAASILVQLYSIYCHHYPSRSYYEEAIAKVIMALSCNVDQLYDEDEGAGMRAIYEVENERL